MKVKDARRGSPRSSSSHKAGIAWCARDRAAPDLKDSSTNVTYLDSGGLGLPDRDYYLEDEFKDKLDAYSAHVGRMLALVKQPADAAADVVAIETELAKVTKTGVETRDVPASYNPTDAKALAKQVKSIDWAAYWKALGVKPSAKIIVGHAEVLRALDGMRAKFKPAQWASYFTYHLLAKSASTLPKAFDDEAFELQKVLTGVEKQKERYKRCIDATQRRARRAPRPAVRRRSTFRRQRSRPRPELVDAIVRVDGRRRSASSTG